MDPITPTTWRYLELWEVAGEVTATVQTGRVEFDDDLSFVDVLDGLGSEGWELVSARRDDPYNAFAFLKVPFPPTDSNGTTHSFLYARSRAIEADDNVVTDVTDTVGSPYDKLRSW